jgi:hypothetical protein
MRANTAVLGYRTGLPGPLPPAPPVVVYQICIPQTAAVLHRDVLLLFLYGGHGMCGTAYCMAIVA